MSEKWIEEALASANVQAFLRVVRAGESHPTDSEAYRALYGWRPGNGRIFDSFADHPRAAVMSPWGWTSAAGAYQAMCAVPGKVKTDTWGDFIRACGPHDFSPASQDRFAVWCTARRGALEDVEAGRLEPAITKCSKEWASLPGSPYGQPTKTLEACRAIYLKAGGYLESAYTDTPAEEADPAPPPAEFRPQSLKDIVTGKEPAMPAPAVLAPLIGAAASTLFDVVSDLFRGHGSKTSTRNAEIIEAVGPVLVDVAKTVTGVSSIDGATERVLTDPDARTAFRQTVEADLDRLVGMVDRLTQIEDDSRDRAAARALKEAHDLAPRMASEQFWLVAAVGLVIGAVAIVDVWKDGAITEGVMALLAGFAVWAQQKRGTVVDYRFGSSASSQMKDEVIAAARK